MLALKVDLKIGFWVSVVQYNKMICCISKVGIIPRDTLLWDDEGSMYGIVHPSVGEKEMSALECNR